MCGIAGAVGGPPPDEQTLARMAEAMAHRGPDDQQTWSDDVCGLAFRRLAVIDLHPRSSQPLHLGDLHLAFNGEIYNYRELREELRGLGHQFVTEGDGEVILHAWRAWGEAALDRMNGMFAMALWDAAASTLTLASDPFGEKPLYYVEQPGRLVFASDIRAILHAADAGGPNDEALAAFVAREQSPDPAASFFRSVRRLPGANLLRWSDGRASVRRYWTPAELEAPRTYDEAVAELRELLVDSIRIRLRSDVPVGTSLSGGIDSSTIATLIAQLDANHRRHAFTASFAGSSADERHYADLAANAAAVIEHHIIEPQPASFLEDLEQVVRDQEEPFGSAAIYAQWCVFRAARETGVVVLLDGQGADELFGGYEGQVREALRPRGAAAVARGLASRGPERQAALASVNAHPAGRLMLRALGRVIGSPYASRDAAHVASSHPPPQPAFMSRGGALRQELVSETFVTSLPMLLRYADRDSMAHSREVRLPFLDRRIAEFAFSLPADFLYRDGVTKSVLRDAARDLVPSEILARRDKLAFGPPQDAWLASREWQTRVAQLLLDRDALGAALYDRSAIEADLRRGKWRDSRAVWRLLSVELWLRAFSDVPVAA
jgi:asparagine synthase (glutamine-hydrolysing)